MGGLNSIETQLNTMIDPGCSTIDKHEDHRVPEDQDNPDFSASFNKDAG